MFVANFCLCVCVCVCVCVFVNSKNIIHLQNNLLCMYMYNSTLLTSMYPRVCVCEGGGGGGGGGGPQAHLKPRFYKCLSIAVIVILSAPIV